MAGRGIGSRSATDETFVLGMKGAVLVGFAGLALFDIVDVFSLLEPVNALFVVLLFPVYLVFVAMVLTLWQGEDPDESDLEQVADPEYDPWENWPW